MRRPLFRHAVMLFYGLVLLTAAACSRGDEDTAGGAASATIPPVEDASPTPSGNTGAASGGSGVSGSLGGTGETAPAGVSGGSGASGQSGATANAVDVTAVEYEFRLDGDVPVGNDGFVLTNDGDEPHELIVMQLEGGKTLQDVRDAIEGGVAKQPPSWITPVTRTFAKPGQTSDPAIAQLEDGQTYVIACFVTTKKGVPHAALGMLDELQVA
jgi:hypothetical protein